MAQKIAAAKGDNKAKGKVKTTPISVTESRIKGSGDHSKGRLSGLAHRITELVTAGGSESLDASGAKPEAQAMHSFNSQFQHFQDDAPACDICGSITVRNGTCYKCFNCGNSMGCS